MANAVRIPGAIGVALIAPDAPAVTWWAGGRTPTNADAAAAAGVAVSAAALVRLTAGDDLDDVLITSSVAFHVLRVVRAADGSEQVAHLMLRRAGANLAMARHEFRTLTEAAALPAATPGRHAASVPPASAAPTARSGEPAPFTPSPDLADESDSGQDSGPADGTESARGKPALPKRLPGNRNGLPAAATAEGAGTVPTAWLGMFGQPFGNDETVLERVLGTLHDL